MYTGFICAPKRFPLCELTIECFGRQLFGNFTLLSIACDRVLRGGRVTVSVSLVVVVLSGGVHLPVTVELNLEEIKCSTPQIVCCNLS